MSNSLSIECQGAPRDSRVRRRVSELAAAIIGVGVGVAFANPVLAAAGGVWSDFVIPAYQTMIENGILAWCM
jgi:hypothetical protein